MNNLQNLFSKTELYSKYFAKHSLGTNELDLVLTNGKFVNKDMREKSIKAFLDFLISLNENPIGIDYASLKELNMVGLMYSGLINNYENLENKLSDSKDVAYYSRSFLDNVFMADELNGDLLISMVALRFNSRIVNDCNENSLKIINEYLDENNNETILLAKFQKYLDITKANNEEDDNALYLEKLLNDNIGFRDFDIDKEIRKNSDDVYFKMILENINSKSIVLTKKEKFRINEKNSNLFTNENIEIRDRKFWNDKFNAMINSHETYNFLSWKEKNKGVISKLFKGEKNENGEFFNTTIFYVDPSSGLNKTVMEIHPLRKKISVPDMPDDDNVYNMMALAAKSKNIKKPCVNVWEKSKDNRKEFVVKTVQALMAVGYDIADIAVPKDCEEFILPFKEITQGITDSEEVQSTPIYDGKMTDVQKTFDEKEEHKSENSGKGNLLNGTTVSSEEKVIQNVQGYTVPKDSKEQNDIIRSEKSNYEQYAAASPYGSSSVGLENMPPEYIDGLSSNDMNFDYPESDIGYMEPFENKSSFKNNIVNLFNNSFKDIDGDFYENIKSITKEHSLKMKDGSKIEQQDYFKFVNMEISKNLGSAIVKLINDIADEIGDSSIKDGLKLINEDKNQYTITDIERIGALVDVLKDKGLDLKAFDDLYNGILNDFDSLDYGNMEMAKRKKKNNSYKS